MFDVLIIGGGAAGFYAALNIAQQNNGLKIAILEKGRNVLSKVKISGGGRCNVTNALSEPSELVKNYPRGFRELLGPFHNHNSQDTVAYFEDRGVSLKTESDGRIFPVTDSSQTVIDFFLKTAEKYKISVIRNTPVIEIVPLESSDNCWKVVSNKKEYMAKYVLVSTGGNNKIWNMLARLGYSIVQPMPSLFSFNIQDQRISGLQGLSTVARVTVIKKKFTSKEITVGLKSTLRPGQELVAEGPVLITHWGLSGPAILKLSAWGARELFEYSYRFRIEVNWLPDYHKGGVIELLKGVKKLESRKTVYRTNALEIPKKLWSRLVIASGIPTDLQWAQLTTAELENLAKNLTASLFMVEGKSTNKDEFVTAGGVDLKQIDFKTFKSKIHPNLYFAGEVLDIDGITGGFNFQSAWTGAFLAAKDIALSSQ